MTSTQSALAESLANLRTSAQENCAQNWLPDALQTLILTILTRLFTRLENLVLQWQAGQLPHPAARPPVRDRRPASQNTPTKTGNRGDQRSHARAPSLRAHPNPDAPARQTSTSAIDHAREARPGHDKESSFSARFPRLGGEPSCSLAFRGRAPPPKKPQGEQPQTRA